MIAFINKLNQYRNNSFSKKHYEAYLILKYYIRNLVDFMRGLIQVCSGKVAYEHSYRPLIIGSKTELLVRPGCSIVLKNSCIKPHNCFYNNQVFSTATSIGTRPHFLALDPPALSSTRVELIDESALILEPNTMILSGTYISASNGARIYIGENSYIAQEVVINSRNSIKIGKNVLIAQQALILDYNAHSITDGNSSAQEAPNALNPNHEINIGDDVWIGARVTILKGVSIGSGSVIGANSCVVSDIPKNVLAVGNPARVVKENIKWQR